MDDWKATDIAVLLKNSLDIIRHRGRFVRYVIYCVSCTIVILWALSEMPTAADKANFGYILLVFWLWCLPFLIYFYKKAFVYDKNPMAYVLTEVILKESHERNSFLKFFTLRFFWMKTDMHMWQTRTRSLARPELPNRNSKTVPAEKRESLTTRGSGRYTYWRLLDRRSKTARCLWAPRPVFFEKFVTLQTVPCMLEKNVLK